MDDVGTVIRKGRAGLVGHAVHDAQQRVGERHTGQALCVVHGVALIHIAVVAANEVGLDHFDSMQGQRVGKVAVGSGNVSLDGVGHGVHTGVSHQLFRHGVGQLGVDDGDIGGDFKVGDRILDALLIIGNDGEGSHLGSSAGGGGDGAEVCLAAQRRDAKDLAHILKGDDPHGLGGIDGGTAADGNDPVRLEFLHCSRALHDGLNGRVRLDTLEQLHFHAGFF